MAPPITISPVAEREIYVAREAFQLAGTIPASAGQVFPMKTFKAVDNPDWLKDESWQGNMGGTQGVYQGPLIGGIDMGGDVFNDVLGHLLWNILGDYTVTGTAASPAAVTTLAVAVGGSTLTVASGGASFTAGMSLWLEDAGTPALNEVVTVVSSTATTITTTPFRFAHLTAMPFTNTAAPYTHVFAMLNGSVGAWNGPAQPPTHTFTDRNGVPATGLAAQYAYTCLSELSFTANADKLLAWTAKTVNQTRQIPGSPLAIVNPSAVQPYPSWRGILGVGGPASGGTLVSDIAEYMITLTRQVKPQNALRGSQLPYVIPRGKLTATGKLMIAPAIDESAYLAMIGNTQPQTQLVASNGLSGANLNSVQIDIGLTQYEKADLTDGDELFGYEVPFEAVTTGASFGGVTMTGASGLKGPVKFTLQNAIPTY